MIENNLERIWRGGTLAARMQRIALTPLSQIFSMVARARSSLYDASWLRAWRAPLPVISIGNLRVGGAGKTPAVLWLIDRLRGLGVRPVVAMRGYGARRGGAPTWLEANDRTDTSRAQTLAAFGFRVVTPERAEHDGTVSDEALLVALRGEVAVASTPDRAAAAVAAAAIGADVLVLDDGFQHRRLHRDLDIVLTQPSERDERVLPAGALREPWRALRRAHAVLSPDPVSVPGTALVVRARAQPAGWVHRVAAAAALAPPESWQGRDAVAVAGIARPERFFAMLEDCGVRVRERRVFRDHHRYSAADWLGLCRSVRAGEWLVTTEKDLVKLGALAGGDARLAALRVETVVEPEVDVIRLVRSVIPRLDAPQGGPHDR